MRALLKSSSASFLKLTGAASAACLLLALTPIPREVAPGHAARAMPAASPACNAGPDIVAQCNGVMLSGATAADPDGDPLTFQWTSSCAGTTFTPSAAVLRPTVFVAAPCNATCVLTLTVSDGTTSPACVDTVQVTVRDTTPPVLSSLPANMTVECNAVPPPPAITALDNCSGVVPVVFSEVVLPAGSDVGCADGQREGYLDMSLYPNIAGCSGGWSIPGILSATTSPACANNSGDDSGNPNGLGCNVADLCAPGWHVALSGVEVGANSPTGAAGAAPTGQTLFFATRMSGPGCGICASGTTTGGTCDNPVSCAAGCLQTDLMSNDVFGVGSLGAIPGPSCSVLDRFSNNACFALGAPWNCSGTGGNEALILTKSGPLAGGVVCVRDTPGTAGCADESVIRRTWAAVDACSNVVSHVQILLVRDTTAPVLTLPADQALNCGSPTDTGATGIATAADNCDPAPVVSFSDETIPGICSANFTIRRTWSAIDRCDNSTSSVQTIAVADTTPPFVVSGGDGIECVWPPNHWWVCFDLAGFAFELEDDCSMPVTWSVDGCASSQPANDIGDGNTDIDCLVSPDGTQVCVRAERQGNERAGRIYTVGVVATDACGNESAALPIGSIHVPHDERQHPDCVKTTTAGLHLTQDLPW